MITKAKQERLKWRAEILSHKYVPKSELFKLREKTKELIAIGKSVVSRHNDEH